MKRRIISFVLCVVLVLSLLPAVTVVTQQKAYAATTSQNNIVARADYFYNLTWTAQSTVYGWNYNYTFYAGSTYRVPYGQPINSGAYVGYYVSIEDFLSAANTAGSVFYTSRSTYDTTSSVYYATDCSAFVSWCWGVDRKTTYSLPQVSTYIGMATASNAYSLQLGDALNSNDVGHVVLVTDLVYSGSTLTSIEITEQTPPQMKRSWYTPSELGAKYGTYYGIYRYSGEVPVAPDGSTNDDSGSSSGTTSGEYYPACDSSCTTFYEGMSNIGITCDWTLHCEIAEANGLTGFSGTAEENETLLSLLKAGRLIIPGSSSSDSGSSGTTGDSVIDGQTGYDRGYAGGMAGSGEYKAFGLDVSSWQGSSLDFNRIKNAGYDYVILRAGTTNGKDECFETYYTNAKAAGLDVGAYYYSYATSVSAVQADMEDFLSYIDGKTYEYPIYFDYEDSTQQALSSSLSQQICLTAMDMLAAEGYLVGMYTGKYFSTQLPMDTICAKYEVWIAHYLAVGDGSYDGTYDYTTYGPTYASQYGMYQFTDSVWINGYGPYDGDVCYKDYPTIVKTYGFNGYTVEGSSGTGNEYIDKNCTFYPSHCQIEVTTANNLYSEPRSASDVLEEAPLGTVYEANGIYINGGGNVWYRVTTSSGEYGYIYSGRVTFVKNLTSDITIKNYDVPSSLEVGDVFSVTGTISSTYNTLNSVAVNIYSGTATSGTALTGGSASASNNKYTLDNSAVDTATSFGDLTDGSYNYVITADYTSYYATSTKEVTATNATVTLVAQQFTVGTGTVTESYFDKCTFYPSHCTFTTNRDTSIFSEPRTAKTGNTSVALEDAPNGTTYTSIGLYVNSGGNIFYEVLTSTGQKGYIYSGYTEYGKKVYSDIKLSGASYPNGHVKGDVFVVSGTISSSYNTLGTAMVYIYSGTSTSGTPVTGGSGSVSDNKYVLANSAIDDATSFGSLATGLYTYSIKVTYTSYYAVSKNQLGTTTATRTLKTHYFTVISSSADQSSCSHSNKTAAIKAATCTAEGTQVTYCTKCGLTEKGTVEALGHSYGSYVVTTPATCTEAGSKEKTCTVCGKVYTKTIAAKGHSYEVTTTPATCTEYAINKYTCSSCGDSYQQYAGEYTDWSTTKPTDIPDKLIESKTQYRYKDYSTLTSYEANLDGYTLVSSQWEQTGTGKVTYVKSWPSGFPTSSNTYATYNNISQKVSASETTTDKTVVDSDALVGYLWYHWCSNGGDTSTSYETDSNWCFHVFFSTTTPSQADNYDSSDGSYKLSSSTQCAYCVWYWPVAVYEQNYTTYQNLFTYEKWSSWSSWSDDAIEASDTRKVGTRTVYRYIDAELGEHTWDAGNVTTQAGCSSEGVKTYTCTSCGATKTEAIAATGHAWKDATCTEPQTCSECGATTGTKLGHDYAAATCTTAKTCKRCGKVSGDPLGHSYRGKVTTEATCTTDGVKTYTCSSCSDSYTESISAIGHSYAGGKCGNCGDTKVVSVNGSFNDWAGQNMTWTENGYTATIKLNAGTYTFKIVKDGAWLGNNGTIADTTITTSDIGWEFVDAGDCTLVATGGTYTFTFNFDTNFLVITCDHIHSHVAGQVVAPTCTDKGYTVYTCACGDSYNGDEVAALGHNYVGKVTTEATCTTDGVMTYTCSSCSDSYTESISAIGHSYAGGKCGSCGDTKVVSVNGSFNDWAGQNLTWTENGYTVTIKLDAGEYKFKIIKDGTWLGNNGTIVDTTTATSDIGWEFVDAGDCTLITTGGTYTFTFNFDTNFLVLTYTHIHAFTAGEVVDPTCTDKGYTVYSCPCGDTENRDEISAKGHSYDNGEITTAPGCTSEGIKTYTCGTCGDTYTENVAAMGHNYSSKVTAPTCTEQGFTTHTCSRCSDSYVDSYVTANGHSYQSVVTPPECTKDGYTTHTCSVCGDSYKDSYVSPSGHTWMDATCTEAMTCSVCGTSIGNPLGHSYKAVVTAPDCVNQGYTTHTCAICSDTFTDGYVPANGHSWADATCTDPMTCSVCKATSGEALGHRYSSVVTAPECLKDGYTTHTCSVCGDSYRNNFVTATGHSWSVATCTAPMSCSKCQATLGSALGHSYVDVVTDPTCSAQGYTTHTCDLCGDSYVDSYTDPTGHIWVDGKCECGKYALQHTGATLTLESEVKYNLYFYLNDPTINLENVGLLTFLSEPTDATVENASYVLDTMFYDSNQNSNAMRTQGIPAKEMGDTLYLRLYATMEDGTIVYGKLISYSAKTYATNILKKASSSETLKNTVVALMNYGAEAQKRLGYKTDTLMNAEISADYQAMQVPYSADLLDGRVKADAAKIAGLTATEDAFTSKYAQLTLEGALAINYLFQANKTVDNDQMTLYYWTATTYASVEELTLDNADGTLESTINGSFYQFVYDGIAAKEMDDTIYVLAVYESEGEACMSGVVSYSVEHFCRSQINSATQNAALCEALTIYGYYAKLIFNVD